MTAATIRWRVQQSVSGGRLAGGMSQTKRIFIVAGEHSGDVLGGKLIGALKEKVYAAPFAFAGVGGGTWRRPA